MDDKLFKKEIFSSFLNDLMT